MANRGEVVDVLDNNLILPPQKTRTLHSGVRPFLVFSSNRLNNGGNVPNVFGFPLSHKEPRAVMSGLNIEVPLTEHGDLTDRSWILVGLGQPVPKELLRKRRTSLSDDTMKEVEDALLEFLAIY